MSVDARSALLRLAGLTALLWLALAAPAQAQWAWKDARGQVHISDLPPPLDIPDKDVLKRPKGGRNALPAPAAAASAASAATVARVDPELQAKRGKAEQEQKDKARAEDERMAAQRSENCARARQQAATIDSGIRMAKLNAQGEREVLDDKGRAAEMARAQQVIASDCK